MITKTRSRGLPDDPYVYLNRVGFPHYAQCDRGTTPGPAIVETIEYEKKGKSHSNICYHSISMGDYECSAGPINVHLWASAARTPEASGRWLVEDELWARRLGGSFADCTADLGNDRRTAQFNAATTLMGLGMKPLFNIPLAVLELKDAPRTLEFCDDAMRLSDRITSVSGKAYLDTIGLADLAKGNLWYKYGIKPSTRDFRSAFKELQHCTAVVKPIQNGKWYRGQKLRVPYSITSTDMRLMQSKSIEYTGRLEAANGRTFVNTRGMFENFANIVKVSVVEGVVYGTLKADYMIDTDVYHQARFDLGTGLLSTTYEVIPLSFVLDWFTDVGSWLRDMERRRVALSFKPTFVEGIWMTESWQDRVVAEVPKTIISPGPYNFTGENTGFVDYVMRASFHRWALRSYSGNAEGRIFSRIPYDGASVRPLGSGTMNGIPYKLGAGLAMLASKIPTSSLSATAYRIG